MALRWRNALPDVQRSGTDISDGGHGHQRRGERTEEQPESEREGGQRRTRPPECHIYTKLAAALDEYAKTRPISPARRPRGPSDGRAEGQVDPSRRREEGQDAHLDDALPAEGQVEASEASPRHRCRFAKKGRVQEARSPSRLGRARGTTTRYQERNVEQLKKETPTKSTWNIAKEENERNQPGHQLSPEIF